MDPTTDLTIEDGPATPASTGADASAGTAGGREPGARGADGLPEGMTPEQHDRAVFQRLASDAPGMPEVEPPFAVGDEGASGAAPGDSGPGSSTPSSPSEPGAAAAPDGAELREAQMIARSALQRDGLPKATIDRLVTGATAEELREVAQSARTRQANYDRIGNEVRDLRAGKQGKRSTTPDDDGDEPRRGSAGSNQDDDLAGLPKAFADHVQYLRDNGDEQQAEVQAAVYREMVNQNRRGQDSGAGDLSHAQMAEKLREPFDALQREFPQLADNAQRVGILETADRLLAAGVIPTEGRHADDVTREVLHKAAVVRFGEPDPRQAQARLHREHHQQLNGQPTPGSNAGGGGPAPATEPDADRAALRAMIRGASVHQARQVKEQALAGTASRR